MNMRELATMIENEWMTYNAAVVNRLHQSESKTRLANLMINNAKDIITALRAYKAPLETADVVTGDLGEPPRKTKKKGDGNGER